MRTLILLTLSALSAFAAPPTIISATAGASPTQIRLEYTDPNDGVCKIEASEQDDYATVVPDVDPALFPGDDLDTRGYLDGAWTDSNDSTHRVFVLGTRDIKQASNGNQVSTALKYDQTLYYIRLGCGASYAETAETTATTAYPTYGRSTRDPFILTEDHFSKWQTVDYNDRSWWSTDPFTGAPLVQFSLPQDTRRVFTAIPFTACNVTAGWSGCGVLSAGDSTYAGTTRQPLVMKLHDLPFAAPYAAFTEDYESSFISWIWTVLHTVGYFSGADLADADRTAQFCFSFVLPASCEDTWVDAVLPTSSGTTDVGTRVAGSLLGAQYRPSSYREWSDGYIYTVSGASTEIHFTEASDCERIIPTETLNVPLPVGNSVTTDISVTATDCMTLTATISSAVNLDPTAYAPAEGWPYRYYAGFEYNPRLALMIRKKSTTASNTMHLTGLTFDFGGGASVANTSGGFHEFGSQFEDAEGNYKVRAQSKVYAYDPITGAGATLGQVLGFSSGGLVANQSCGSSGHQFWIDANSFYCTGARTPDAKPAAFRVTLTGNAAADVDHPPTGDTNQNYPDGITWAVMSDDIIALTEAFEPDYDGTLYPGCAAFAFTGGRYLIWQCAYSGAGSQDALSWIIVYDMGNGLPFGSGGDGEVIAAWNPALGPGESAWSVFHTGMAMAPLQEEDGVNLVVWQGKAGKNEYAGNPRYSFSYAGEYWDGSGFVSGDVPNPCDPCRIKISGTPTAPVAPTTLKDIAANETFAFISVAGTEFFRVVSVDDTDDITIEGPFDPQGSDYPARAWPNGTYGYMQPWWGINTHMDEGSNVDAARWDFLADPHGPTTVGDNFCVSVLSGGGHSWNYNHVIGGAPPLGGIVIPMGLDADRSVCPIIVETNTTFHQNNDEPKFGNHYAPSFGTLGEGHPSFKPGMEMDLIVDSRPLVSPAASMNNITHVSGTLFELTYLEGGTEEDGMSRKHHVFAVGAHSRIFEDISGPSSTLGDTAADKFKFCIPLVDDECVSGSVAGMGKVYINDPLLVPPKWEIADESLCTGDGQTPGDLCAADLNGTLATVWAFHVPHDTSDSTNNVGFWPVLSQTGQCYRPCKGNTDNGKLLWGNWFMYGWQPQTKGQLITSVLVKLPTEPPPYTEDNSAHLTGTVNVSSVPAMTDNVIVRFGFREFSDGGLYCFQRREACIANQSVVDEDDPYIHPTEAGGEEMITGVPCSSSCTVAVPVIPGYMAYGTLVYRDAMNEEIGTYQLAPFAGGDSSPTPTGNGPQIGGHISVGGNIRFN